jgi:hypothetical protein
LLFLSKIRSFCLQSFKIWKRYTRMSKFATAEQLYSAIRKIYIPSSLSNSASSSSVLSALFATLSALPANPPSPSALFPSAGLDMAEFILKAKSFKLEFLVRSLPLLRFSIYRRNKNFFFSIVFLFRMIPSM